MKIKLTSEGKRFFGTKKHHLSLQVVSRPVSLSGGYWDGGSRSEYHGITKTGSIISLTYPTAPREYGGGPTPEIMPTDDMAIVRGGTFLGKEAMLTVHVLKQEWFSPTWGIMEG